MTATATKPKKAPKKNEPQKVAPKIPGFYTTAEAAKRLGVDKSRVDQYCRAGGPLVGKFEMVGIQRLFKVDVIEEFAKIERTKGGPKPGRARPPAPAVKSANVPTPSANGHARPAGPKAKPKGAGKPKKAGKAKPAAPKKAAPGKTGNPAKAPNKRPAGPRTPKKQPSQPKPAQPAPAAPEIPTAAA